MLSIHTDFETSNYSECSPIRKNSFYMPHNSQKFNKHLIHDLIVEQIHELYDNVYSVYNIHIDNELVYEKVVEQIYQMNNELKWNLNDQVLYQIISEEIQQICHDLEFDKFEEFSDF